MTTAGHQSEPALRSMTERFASFTMTGLGPFSEIGLMTEDVRSTLKCRH